MFFAGLLMLLIVGCVAAASPSMFVFIPFYILQGAAQTGLFLVAYTMCMYVYHDVGSVFEAFFYCPPLDKLGCLISSESASYGHGQLWCKEIISSCTLPSLFSCLQLSNKENEKGNCNTDCMYIDKNQLTFLWRHKISINGLFLSNNSGFTDIWWTLDFMLIHVQHSCKQLRLFCWREKKQTKKTILFSFRILWRKYYS